VCWWGVGGVSEGGEREEKGMGGVWEGCGVGGVGVTVGEGLEKLSQGRNFFFLIPTPAQLSAYANHEFKIIPTPTQLSAYANHELKN